MCARRSRWCRLRRSCRGGAASLATATPPYAPGAGTGTYEGGKISGGGHTAGGGGDCAGCHTTSACCLALSVASAKIAAQHMRRRDPWATLACTAGTCPLAGRICW